MLPDAQNYVYNLVSMKADHALMRSNESGPPITKSSERPRRSILSRMDKPTPTLDEFRAAVDAAFAFLVRDYGYERLDEPREYNEYSVRFRKGELGVDVYGESYGQTAACELVRGNDRLGPGFLVPRAERRPMRSGQLAQIEDIANFLRRYASEFLRGDCSQFDAALAEWKRITKHRPLTEAVRLERELSQAVTAAGHAAKRNDHAEVVRLLEPHADALSLHQRRMLEAAREKLK